MVLSLIALAAIPAPSARAGDVADGLRHVRSVIESLVPSFVESAKPGRGDVIAPPTDIDPRMAMVPPSADARMPILQPGGTQSR
jgi:hypothetical protein